MSQSQRHRWVQWHPHTPSLTKVNATVEFKLMSPYALSPLGSRSHLGLSPLAPQVNGAVGLVTSPQLQA